MDAHFSIDDVIGVFRWLYHNQPSSAFDTIFFGTLREWHRKYGIKVSCYCFWEDGQGFSLDMLPPRYWQELGLHRKWLYWGYHGSLQTSEEAFDENRFLREYREFGELLRNNGCDNMARMVRCHRWTATHGCIEEMSRNGVRTLLCPEAVRAASCQYDIGSVGGDNVEHVTTDIRLDNEEDIECLKKMKKEKLIFFLHEWTFAKRRDIYEQMIQKIDGVNYL